MTASAYRGLLDTNSVILLPQLADAATLPAEPLISTITLAELSVEPLVATSEQQRAARQAHVQQATRVLGDHTRRAVRRYDRDRRRVSAARAIS